MVYMEFKGSLLKNSLSIGEVGLFVLLKPSTDFMKLTCIVESGLLTQNSLIQMLISSKIIPFKLTLKINHHNNWRYSNYHNMENLHLDKITFELHAVRSMFWALWSVKESGYYLLFLP